MSLRSTRQAAVVVATAAVMAVTISSAAMVAQGGDTGLTDNYVPGAREAASTVQGTAPAAGLGLADHYVGAEGRVVREPGSGRASAPATDAAFPTPLVAGIALAGLATVAIAAAFRRRRIRPAM